jgi:hypothetical protein
MANTSKPVRKIAKARSTNVRTMYKNPDGKAKERLNNSFTKVENKAKTLSTDDQNYTSKSANKPLEKRVKKRIMAQAGKKKGK